MKLLKFILCMEIKVYVFLKKMSDVYEAINATCKN